MRFAEDCAILDILSGGRTGHTEIWGNGTGGTSENSFTIPAGPEGTSTPVFGETPAQQTPFPGSYTDTIMVTVTF